MLPDVAHACPWTPLPSHTITQCEIHSQECARWLLLADGAALLDTALLGTNLEGGGPTPPSVQADLLAALISVLSATTDASSISSCEELSALLRTLRELARGTAGPAGIPALASEAALALAPLLRA